MNKNHNKMYLIVFEIHFVNVYDIYKSFLTNSDFYPKTRMKQTRDLSKWLQYYWIVDSRCTVWLAPQAHQALNQSQNQQRQQRWQLLHTLSTRVPIVHHTCFGCATDYSYGTHRINIQKQLLSTTDVFYMIYELGVKIQLIGTKISE